MVDNPDAPFVLGAILAGGAATRLGDRARGGDKCLVEIGGAPLLAHVLARLAPQVGEIVLSANGDPARFAPYGLAVVPDAEPGQGPLGGVLAALAEAERRGWRFCLSVPGDAPLLPRDLAPRLLAAIGDAPCAVAASHGQRQSVFALWRVEALPDLRQIYGDGTRSLWRAQESLGAALSSFDDEEAFAGLNEPGDRQRLESLIGVRP